MRGGRGIRKEEARRAEKEGEEVKEEEGASARKTRSKGEAVPCSRDQTSLPSFSPLCGRYPNLSPEPLGPDVEVTVDERWRMVAKSKKRGDRRVRRGDVIRVQVAVKSV